MSKDSVRWQIIKRGRARIGAEEIELLVSYARHTTGGPDQAAMSDKSHISLKYQSLEAKNQTRIKRDSVA